jgi:hypothetical protein
MCRFFTLIYSKISTYNLDNLFNSRSLGFPCQSKIKTQINVTFDKINAEIPFLKDSETWYLPKNLGKYHVCNQ